MGKNRRKRSHRNEDGRRKLQIEKEFLGEDIHGTVEVMLHPDRGNFFDDVVHSLIPPDGTSHGNTR